MANASVRPAQAGDGLAIATIQLEIWQTCFGEVLPDQVLERPPAELAAEWTAQLADALVAVEGAALVGFALVPRFDGPIGEIGVLYVRPAWARRGHGGRLLAACAARLRASGAASGQWWVPVTDVASNRFAASVGWTRTEDSRSFDTGRGTLRERLWTGSLDLQLR